MKTLELVVFTGKYSRGAVCKMSVKNWRARERALDQFFRKPFAFQRGFHIEILENETGRDLLYCDPSKDLPGVIVWGRDNHAGI